MTQVLLLEQQLQSSLDNLSYNSSIQMRRKKKKKKTSKENNVLLLLPNFEKDKITLSLDPISLFQRWRQEIGNR